MDGKLRGSAATCDDQERRLHALGTAQQERLLLHDCKGGPGSDGATALVFRNSGRVCASVYIRRDDCNSGDPHCPKPELNTLEVLANNVIAAEVLHIEAAVKCQRRSAKLCARCNGLAATIHSIEATRGPRLAVALISAITCMRALSSARTLSPLLSRPSARATCLMPARCRQPVGFERHDVVPAQAGEYRNRAVAHFPCYFLRHSFDPIPSLYDP